MAVFDPKLLAGTAGKKDVFSDLVDMVAVDMRDKSRAKGSDEEYAEEYMRALGLDGEGDYHRDAHFGDFDNPRSRRVALMERLLSNGDRTARYGNLKASSSFADPLLGARAVAAGILDHREEIYDWFESPKVEPKTITVSIADFKASRNFDPAWLRKPDGKFRKYLGDGYVQNPATGLIRGYGMPQMRIVLIKGRSGAGDGLFGTDIKFRSAYPEKSGDLSDPYLDSPEMDKKWNGFETGRFDVIEIRSAAPSPSKDMKPNSIDNPWIAMQRTDFYKNADPADKAYLRLISDRTLFPDSEVRILRDPDNTGEPRFTIAVRARDKYTGKAVGETRFDISSGLTISMDGYYARDKASGRVRPKYGRLDPLKCPHWVWDAENNASLLVRGMLKIATETSGGDFSFNKNVPSGISPDGKEYWNRLVEAGGAEAGSERSEMRYGG